jgi:quinol-cytochrome oxidoreductase complex cytochrome b subunit
MRSWSGRKGGGVETNPSGKKSVLGWIEARVNLTEIVSFLSVFGLLPSELDSRKPLREALREAMSRPLPSYARWPHVLGILSFILFLFLGVTGVMLAFYYQPTADVAYSSVSLIARDVAFGTLLHQSHYWAAALFLIVLGARVVRFFFTGLYAQSREVIWMVAVLTFVFATIADLTGRLLPWDATGYWTTVRAREVTDALPVLGPITAFLVGGSGLDSLVLTRYYVLHIAVFPLALIGLFYIHFASIRRVGLSRVSTTPGTRSLRVAMYDLLLLVIFMVGGLITFAVLLPQPFGVPADPFVTPPDARPPWYLLAPYTLMEAFPSFVPAFLRGLIPELMLAAVLLLPFLDPESGSEKRHRFFPFAGFAVLILWAALAVTGYYMEVRR